jgi:hypothetical protein
LRAVELLGLLSTRVHRITPKSALSGQVTGQVAPTVLRSCFNT